MSTSSRVASPHSRPALAGTSGWCQTLARATVFGALPPLLEGAEYICAAGRDRSSALARQKLAQVSQPDLAYKCPVSHWLCLSAERAGELGAPFAFH